MADKQLEALLHRHLFDGCLGGGREFGLFWGWAVVAHEML